MREFVCLGGLLMLALVVGVDCALLLPECVVSLVWLLLMVSDPSGLGLRCGDLVSKCGWGGGGGGGGVKSQLVSLLSIMGSV